MVGHLMAWKPFHQNPRQPWDKSLEYYYFFFLLYEYFLYGYLQQCIVLRNLIEKARFAFKGILQFFSVLLY